ncbi:unnamed protein product [Caenorhabditis nigoni]
MRFVMFHFERWYIKMQKQKSTKSHQKYPTQENLRQNEAVEMRYRMLLSFFFTTTSSVAKGIFGLINLTQKMRFLPISRKDRKVQPI